LLSVSTSEVYGAGRAGACSEELPAQFGPAPSARAEFTMEVALQNLVARGLLHATIVRPFNVAGPGQSPVGGHVLPRFLQQAARGEPLTVYGDGTQRRAFSHVGDVAAALELVDANGLAGTVYDLGVAGNRTTIGELAELVVAVTGSNAGIERVDPRQLHGDLFAEAPERWPESRRIHALGWRPQHDLRAIVEDAWREASSRRP
jgi:UDP-glucose 4-epimerase